MSNKSTRKIADLPIDKNTCRDAEHNPPTMVHLTPGIYEHTCPNCGHTQILRVKQELTLKA